MEEKAVDARILSQVSTPAYVRSSSLSHKTKQNDQTTETTSSSRAYSVSISAEGIKRAEARFTLEQKNEMAVFERNQQIKASSKNRELESERNRFEQELSAEKTQFEVKQRLDKMKFSQQQSLMT